LCSTHLREDKVTNHTSTCPWRTDNLIGSISLIEKSSATHFHEPSAGAHDGVHLFRVVDLQPPIHPMRCLPGHSLRVSHQRTMICCQGSSSIRRLAYLCSLSSTVLWPPYQQFLLVSIPLQRIMRVVQLWREQQRDRSLLRLWSCQWLQGSRQCCSELLPALRTMIAFAYTIN
jgi:hypothetical protein